jgi:hypothetical protein
MRRLLITTVLALSALSLVGCTAGSGANTSNTGDSQVAPAPQGAPEQADSGFATGGRDASGKTISEPRGRQVITTGRLALTVEDPAAAADDVARIVERAGGRVDARTENPSPVPLTEKPEATGSDVTTPSRDRAQLTVRIPSSALTATLLEVKRLGTVLDSSLTSQDVTSQSQDLDARVTALRTSVDRLVALMAKADSTADLIAIESALSERQANLESLEAQKRVLDSQVELATITVELSSVADAPVETPDTFLSGLAAGWNAFVAFFAGVVVVLGVLIPWIALAAVITAVALLVVRKRKATKIEA